MDLKEKVVVREALSKQEIGEVRMLFKKYVDTFSHMPDFKTNIELQGFKHEVDSLPGVYARPSGRLLLATINGKACGCVALKALSAKDAEIKRLFVLDSHRGRGIGKALVKEIIDMAKAIGYQKAVLDTLPEMEGAIRLYHAFGFRKTAPFHPEETQRTIFMELTLDR